MRERVVQIGYSNQLVGIMTQPDTDALRNDSVAIILLNSGVIHRVGSCRLSVTLARAIAERAGVICMRFDFSGIGDSDARRTTLTAAELAVDEVREVMEYLKREKNIKQFILYGLCSGAYASYRTALKDDRIIGIAQIDGYCYMSWKSYLHYYVPRIFSLRRWSNLIRRLFGLQTPVSGAEKSGIDSKFFEVPDFGNFPPQAEVASGLQQLAQRGLKLFSVFCRSDHYHYEGQFQDCFSSVQFGDNHQLIYLTQASHILAEPEDQALVVSSIADWVKKIT